MAPRDELTVGKTLCPDRGDDLPCFSRTWVGVGDSVINLWKKEKKTVVGTL